MPDKIYPKHDINQVFDYIHNVLMVGDCKENAVDELQFVNRLFAALPAEAVEQGMRFLHGNTDIPGEYRELMPLYIRFINLVEYCEVIEKLRDVSDYPSSEYIQKRIEMIKKLDEIEKPFCKPILGLSYNKPVPPLDTDDLPKEEDTKKGSGLHLMNGCAPVFPCKDPLKTALFYEKNLGFEAVHLDDESMPHIRLSRDNIDIVLTRVRNNVDAGTLREIYSIDNDLYIYVTEPMLLQNELVEAGVKIIKPLEDASVNNGTNREFIFEDIDGRHICVSQREID